MQRLVQQMQVQQAQMPQGGGQGVFAAGLNKGKDRGCSKDCQVSNDLVSVHANLATSR